MLFSLRIVIDDTYKLVMSLLISRVYAVLETQPAKKISIKNVLDLRLSTPETRQLTVSYFGRPIPQK